MSRVKFVFLLAALIYLHAPYASARPDVKADEKTLAHLKKFRSDYVRNMLNGKPEAIRDYYAEDVRLMPEYQKTVLSKSHALSYHKAFSARFDVREYNREEMEILDLDSRVVELGLFNMAVTPNGTNQIHELKGKYLNIWQKSEGGELSLITEAWNYSHHTQLAEQLRFDRVPAAHVALQAHVPVKTNVSFELAALNKLMEVTIAQHDAGMWSQFYADDGMVIYSHQPVHRGKKALNEFLGEHVAGLPIFEKLDIRNDRIDELGNYVIEYASHIAIIRSGDYSGVNTGKDIRIWRREKGGALKIFRSIAMYD